VINTFKPEKRREEIEKRIRETTDKYGYLEKLENKKVGR